MIQAAGPASRPDARHPWLFVLLWIPYAYLVRRFWFVADDAYISFRYARNLAEGHGLTYNPGIAPVEGYSNFLWTLTLAGVERLGGNPALWAPAISFLCGTVLLALVWRILLDRLALPVPVAFLATLSLACFPPFAVWSTGGLETMPFSLALFVTFERLNLRPEGPDVRGAACAGLVLALLRVEGVAWAFALAALTILIRIVERRPFAGALGRYAVVVGAGYAAYWAWRFSYYGLPVPNSVYAKVGAGPDVLRTGIDYVAIHVATFLTPLLLVPGCVVACRARYRVPGIAVAAVALGMLLYAVLVGGDFMAMGRLLVPALAFEALLFAWLLQVLFERGAGGRALMVGIAATTVVLGLLPAWNVEVVPSGVRRAFHFRHNVSEEEHRSEFDQWAYMVANTRRWTLKGLALRDLAPEGGSVVAGAIGCVGYFSGLTVWDKMGLVNHDVAVTAGSAADEKSPGHLKFVRNVYFLDREPTFLDATIWSGGDLAARVSRQLRKWRSWSGIEQYAPDMLACEAQGEEPAYVVAVLRRHPNAVAAAAARADFERRLAAVDWQRLGPDASGARAAGAEGQREDEE